MKQRWLMGTLCLLTLSQVALADATTQFYQQLCTNSTLAEISINSTERTSLRAKGQSYALNITVLANLVGSSANYGDIVKGGAIIICSIILFVVVIITVFILLCFCCCCDHNENPSDKTGKICVGVSLLLLIVCVVMFILTVVYLSKFYSSMTSAGCLIAKLPYDAVYGYNLGGLTFIGLVPLKAILSNLSTDIGSIKNLSSNFDQVISLKLPDSTAKAYSDLEGIYNNYKSSQTFDGKGNKANPESVKSLTKEINSAVGTELSIYKVAAQTLHGAASAGKDFTSGNGTAQVQSTLNEVGGMIDNITQNFLNFSSSVGPIYNQTDKYVPVGLYITASFGAVLVLLFLFAAGLIACSISRHKNCCRCGVKLCLFLVSVMILVLSIVSVVMFIMSFVIGTLCEVIPVALTQSNITVWVSSFNVSLNLGSTIGDLLNTCLATNGTGNISSIFMTNATDFSSIQGFLTNITLYNTLKDNFTASSNYSFTIGNTSKIWSLMRDGWVYDQTNVPIALAEINNDLNCGNQFVVLDQINCTLAGTKTCVPVKTTNGWVPPGCVSNPTTAQTTFSNLKAYCDDENSLLTSMVNALNDTNTPTTPMAQVRKYKGDFWTAFPLFDQVINSMNRTLQNVQSITASFDKSLNCTIVRQELLDMETVLCFNTSRNLASFSNFLALFILFTLLTIYGFCCSLRCTFVQESDIAYEIVDNQPPDNGLYSGKEAVGAN